MSRNPTSDRERLGFRDGEKGTHSSRTLMLVDLDRVLDALPPEAELADFRHAIVEDNVLGKRSAITREHTLWKLMALYGLDPSVAVYRVMRALWERDPEGRPLLALLCAAARDPLLRASIDSILELPLGAVASSELMARTASQRFSETTRRSIGGNLLSTWSQAGFLEGSRTKIRTQPQATPGVAVYALALGFMEGGRGALLLSTTWTRLLDCPQDDLMALVKQAARRGWMEYRVAGDVVDLRVEGLFGDEERGWCDGQQD